MWPFLAGSPAIPLSVINTLTSGPEERSASVVAVVDTGYSGFILVTERLFDRLGFGEQLTQETSGRLADGSVIRLRSGFGTIKISDPEVELHGRVETCKGIEGVLLGIEGIQGLALTIDSCSQESFARVC